MNSRNRSRRAAVGGALLASCAVAASLLAAVPAQATYKLTVRTTDGVQGGTAELTVSLSRDAGDGPVSGAQLDVLFDTAQLVEAGACTNGGATCQTQPDCGNTTCSDSPICQLPCQIASRLTQQQLVAQLPCFQNDAGKQRVRLGVDPENLLTPVPFTDGDLLTCTISVPATAPLGPQTVSYDPNPARLDVTNPDADSFTPLVQIESGVILAPTPTPTVTGTPPTPTVTGTPPTATPTVTGTPPATPTVTGTPPTATPTVTGTPPTPTVTGTPPTATPTGTGTPPTPTVTGTPPTPTGTGTPPTPTVTGTPPTATPTVTGTPPTATPTGPTPTATPGAQICVGDCKGVGAVTVDDIIVLVNIALGTADPSACPHGIPGGGEVTIDIIVTAVNNAIDGCPAG